MTKNYMCEKNVSNFVSIREAVLISGMCAQTLRKLGDEQKIRCYKTPSGQRKFDKNSLEELFNKKANDNKNNYIYISQDIYNIDKNKEKLHNIYNEYKILYKNDKQSLDILLEECLNKNINELLIFEKELLEGDNYYIIKYLINKYGGTIKFNYELL